MQRFSKLYCKITWIYLVFALMKRWWINYSCDFHARLPRVPLVIGLEMLKVFTFRTDNSFGKRVEWKSIQLV